MSRGPAIIATTPPAPDAVRRQGAPGVAVPRPADERAFLESVLYSSLFDYPVTVEQLREALIAVTADEQELLHWYKHSALLRSAIEYRDGYFFPRGRRDLLVTRRRREALSRTLLDEMGGALRLIASMPFVRMAALSGSLAHLNADGEADLDLFVITSGRRVWTVTVTMLLLARMFGWRKRVCLNYVISERELRVSPADLFSANQIVHLRPVIGGEVHGRFLDANRFIARFYPNFTPRAASIANPGRFRRIVEGVLDWTFAPLYERLCQVVYSTHLRGRAHTWASREQVRLESECLKLHTSSHRKEVMERFDRAVLDALAAHARARDDHHARDCGIASFGH